MKVIIIGGGQVGSYLAKLLLENNISVKVIENRESVFSKIKTELPQEALVFGNGTDPTVLESVGIADADVVAAVTGADETNLVASTIAKFEFNVSRVIARVNHPQNAWLFNAGMGVDACINQADLIAHLVVEEIDFRNILKLLKINHGSYSIVQVKVNDKSEAVQKALKDLAIPEDAVIIAVYRGEKVIIPRGDTTFNGGDNILAFADKDAQVVLNKLFGE